MRLGIAIEDTWNFFHEIHADLSAHHDVTLFERPDFALPLFNTRINRFLFWRDLRAFLQANDVVFFEWASELLAAATQLPKVCGIVTRLHRYEMYKWADQVNWDAVDKIILVTEAKRQEFLERFPEQEAKTVVIPEAISTEKFEPAPKPFAGDIGILCHLRPRKRVYELVLAFHELNRKRDDLHLHIGGGKAGGFAEYYYAVHTLVKQLGLQEKVTFYDHVDEPQAWYHKVDVFISNSYSEGLQVALLEAMASGCYVLSHQWEGVEELLPPDNLFFTESQLVERILTYCELPEAERQRRKTHLQDIVSLMADVDKTKVQVRETIEAAAPDISG